LKHIKSYTEPVQNAAHLKVGDEGSDAVDLRDRVVVVTGANSGLGKQVATYVAAKGAKLYMVCRSPDKAQAAQEEIQNLTNNPNIQIVLADVAEKAQVRKAAQEIQSKESKIHCLVCNAGVLLNEQKNSSEGIEMTFASHLFCGTYLFTELLLPQLRAADNARVVVVTSGGMYNTGLPSWNVMTSYTLPTTNDTATAAKQKEKFQYSGNMAYAYAKRGQVVLVEEWAKQYQEDASKITFVAAHPGWTDTPAVEEAYGDQKKYLEPMRTPWQGAEGIAWLTAVSNTALQSGALYLDRQPQTKHLSGPFFSEGSFTKNSKTEIEEFMKQLRKAADL
jgi:dehydrogenase/reductase SDR family protein 12